MEISNTFALHGAQSLQGPHRMNAVKETPVSGTQSQPIKDEVRISEEAMKLNETGQTEVSSANVRFELVNRIKSEIAAGTYDTPDKMDIAMDRLLAGMAAR